MNPDSKPSHYSKRGDVDIRLDDFVSMDLVEHMAILMSESLIALTKSKYPYIE